MSELFGLWGGKPPCGWCSFKSEAHGDRLGYGHAGTREEAEAGKLGFEKDNAYCVEHLLYEVFSYEVVPFDPDREPEGVVRLPTDAQAELMLRIERQGDYSLIPLPSNYRRSLDVLWACGWYMQILGPTGREVHRDWTEPKMRLTKAGVESLAQWKAKRG